MCSGAYEVGIVWTVIGLHMPLLPAQWAPRLTDHLRLRLALLTRVLLDSLAFCTIGSRSHLWLLIVIGRNAVGVGGCLGFAASEGAFIWQGVGFFAQRAPSGVAADEAAEGTRRVVLLGEEPGHDLIDQHGFELDVEELHFLAVTLEALRAVLVKHAKVADAFGHFHCVLACWEPRAGEE